jgi:hypothetical protein
LDAVAGLESELAKAKKEIEVSAFVLLICFTSLTIINSYVNSSDVEALDT